MRQPIPQYIRCVLCGHITENTPAGQDRMVDHQKTKHPEENQKENE